MKIIWQTKARTSFQQIAEYIKVKFGMRARRRFVERVHQQEILLRHSPNVGFIEPLLVDRATTYRSIVVNGLSKIVYCVKNDTIHVVAFWDTRCEPETQFNNVK